MEIFYTHLLHIICFLCVAGERTTIDQRNIKHLLNIPGYNMISGSIYNQVVEIQDNYNVKSNTTLSSYASYYECINNYLMYI